MAKGMKGVLRQHLSEEEKASAPKPSMALFKRIFAYLTPYKWQLIGVVVIILISAGLGILPAILTGKIIDEGFLKGDFNLLVILVLASFVVYIINNLIGVLQSFISVWISQHIVYDMKNQMFYHLERMAHSFYTTEKQGSIITRMTSDINGVRDVISGTLVSIFSNVITLIITVFALFSTNIILAIFALVVIPFFILPTRRVGKTRFDITMKSQEKNDQQNQILNETLNVSGSLLLKLFNKENYEYQRFKATNLEITKLNIQENMAGRWYRMTMGTFMNMGPMLIYLVGALLMMKLGDVNLTIGDITIMIALLNRLYNPVNQLFNIQVDVIRSLALFARVFAYFDMPLDIKNNSNAIRPDEMLGNISFENVGFTYENDEVILRDISFEVKAGSTIAIVGPSGAGKSTLINLIPRLYDVSSGAVKIDGHDVKDLDLDFLRGNIGYVTQDTYLFNASIKDNLLYACEEACMDELVAACIKANIYDFISTLPNGFETIVGNRGFKLSGGEKQRISLARTILADPTIFILDEATSSLDSVSEELIQQALEPLFADRTAVVIAHRLSTVISSDVILVIVGGKLVAKGTHLQLLKTSLDYQHLYETQFKHALAEVQQLG